MSGEVPVRRVAGPEYFAALATSCEDAVISVSLDGLITSFNPAAERVFGFSSVEALSKHINIVFPAERQAEVDVLLRKVRSGEPLNPHDAVRITKEGRRIDVSIEYAPIRSAAQGVIGVLQIVRTRSEDELFRQMIQALPGGVVLVDTASTIRLVNAEAEAMFGYLPGELVGQSAACLLPATLREAQARMRDIYLSEPRCLALGKNRDLYAVRKDGSEFPVEVGLNTVRSAGGTYILAVVADITERKQAEEYRARSAEIELQNRRLQEANRLKSEFLTNMSQELRTPLNAIIGFADLLFEGSIDVESPKHKEYLGDILSSGRQLLKLINDVLDLAKIEVGRLDFHPEIADLPQLLREGAAIQSSAAAIRRIHIQVEPDPALTDVFIDTVRFKQVLYNYLSNAIKFSYDCGRVIVRTRAEREGWFRLEVEDTGVGIRPVDVGKLFVEFQQLERGLGKKQHGTGLGLALTRRLVEAQGGSVGVCSMPGEGSTFHAVLPCRALGNAEPRRAEPPTRSVRRGACSVLVVEGDAQHQDVLVSTLTKAGYAVELARTGAEALELCLGRAFDAVTLDLVLPDMNGLDLIEAIRRSGKSQDALIMVVTMQSGGEAIAGYAVQGVLQKPLDPEALLGALQTAGVKPEQLGEILVVDDDPTALQLMDGTLRRFGYRSIGHANGLSALEDAKRLRPAAVVLDLLMPEMDGFQFLDHFRRVPGHERTPVLIWTIKDLTRGEQEELRTSVQSILFKASGAAALLSGLQAFLPVPPPVSVAPPS